MTRFWPHWSFSVMLLAAYVGTFHLWMPLGRHGVIVSGLAASAFLVWLLLQAHARRYFCSRLDLCIHAVVILDILLEATIIPQHEGLTFYGCAAGFALIIGAYRARCLSLLAGPPAA